MRTGLLALSLLGGFAALPAAAQTVACDYSDQTAILAALAPTGEPFEDACGYSFAADGSGDLLARGAYAAGNTVFSFFYLLRRSGTGYVLVGSYEYQPGVAETRMERQGRTLVGTFPRWLANDPTCCPSSTETVSFTGG